MYFKAGEDLGDVSKKRTLESHLDKRKRFKLAYDDEKGFEKAVIKAKNQGVKVPCRCDFLANK